MMSEYFHLGATGFDVLVEAPVARRGLRLASLNTSGKNIEANTEYALAA